MPKNSKHLIFKTKYIDEIIICDYCHYRKCNWLKTNIKNLPDNCPETVSFKITDEQIPKEIFQQRTKIAKKIGVFHPKEKKWYFSVLKANTILSEELQRIIKTINGWS